jgi:hypothetical protein
MLKITKKKQLVAQARKKEDLTFLYENISKELSEVEKTLDNVSYQIKFFGTSPELQKGKQDCELMLQWILNELDQVKKGLFLLNSLQTK